MTAVGADCASVHAKGAVREDSTGPGTVVGCHGRFFSSGVGNLDEGVDQGVAVVGDFDNVVLDRGLDIEGVERVWGDGGAGGFQTRPYRL